MIATRDRIVEAADKLFYEQGFERTSFADAAAAVAISRGNFYYHFKTKDEILDAVIQRRLANTRAMLDQWQIEGASPAARIGCFIEILIRNQSKIKMYGCPVGTLSTELAKLQHPASSSANELFGLFRDWLSDQFALLGRAQDATQLALHLLARSQGIATLASAFQDSAFIEQEVRLLHNWLQSQLPQTTHQ
ncbi:transcriptional regulator [Massilia sp. Root351]|jgi:AcrR family transcriptional regulator|uniref:TetR/AcrR family transcriptional regulator n=1 Tax=Massilia sp. Root351 TaxID=1736522 RepID=UPI00070A8083|nr:TetR/AcrR family transcriptional regulator [Massilia sp. Root351]KQV82603.1 transcriptional regulator [Massilia sp. Root351]